MFHFQDEMFIADFGFVTEFCKRIKERKVAWWGQTRVDNITPEILRLLKDSGCVTISFGVESADNEILKSMRKNITLSQIEKAFSMAEEIGLPATGNIILGDIADTPTSIRSTFNWWIAHRKWDITVKWIWVFPGSFLYQFALENGIITDPVVYLKEGCQQINVTKMSDEEYWDMVSEITLLLFAYEENPELQVNPDFEILHDKLLRICGTSKIALWPAMLTTISALYKVVPKFIASDMVYFVNRNYTTQHTRGLQKFGKPVFSPNVLIDKSIDIVISPARLPIFKEICDIVERGYPNVKRVIHISELLSNGQEQGTKK